MYKCLGARYRYSESIFLSKDLSLVKKQQLRLLKKQSCNGRCNENTNILCYCEILSEYASEYYEYGDLNLPEGVKDGDTLQLKLSGDDDGIDEIYFDKV